MKRNIILSLLIFIVLFTLTGCEIGGMNITLPNLFDSTNTTTIVKTNDPTNKKDDKKLSINGIYYEIENNEAIVVGGDKGIVILIFQSI